MPPGPGSPQPGREALVHHFHSDVKSCPHLEYPGPRGPTPSTARSVCPSLVGLRTGALDTVPAARAPHLAAEVEELAYGAIWVPEVAGRDPFVHLAPLLSATDHIVRAQHILGSTPLLCPEKANRSGDRPRLSAHPRPGSHERLPRPAQLREQSSRARFHRRRPEAARTTSCGSSLSSPSRAIPALTVNSPPTPSRCGRASAATPTRMRRTPASAPAAVCSG